MELDLEVLLPLPATPNDASDKPMCRVGSLSLVRYRTTDDCCHARLEHDEQTTKAGRSRIETEMDILQVAWARCGNDEVCRLYDLDLDSLWVKEGVYVIWFQGADSRPATVYVGQGEIADRLADHRIDQAILAYGAQHSLNVTWCNIMDEATRKGVEAFLAEVLKPLLGTHHPNVRPIAVNLP